MTDQPISLQTVNFGRSKPLERRTHTKKKRKRYEFARIGRRRKTAGAYLRRQYEHAHGRIDYKLQAPSRGPQVFSDENDQQQTVSVRAEN